MVHLILHRDVVYEDDTVYLNGQAYENCRFAKCTLVIRDGPLNLSSCSFEDCVWHIDTLLYDIAQAKALGQLLTNIEANLSQSNRDEPAETSA
jgi:hypothetical protein